MKINAVIHNQAPFEFKSDKFEKSGIRCTLQEQGPAGSTLLQFMELDLTHEESKALGDLTGKQVSVNVTKIRNVFNGAIQIQGHLTVNK